MDDVCDNEVHGDFLLEADTRVHLLRHAVVPGIGTPDQRRRSGKPPRGCITLPAAAARSAGARAPCLQRKA